ncbi:uncharacterized protein B0H18DRAFT_659507 [Fomitopsis serialis]|uniref:uncharacterized protein n=1 Tax=Fomitopsis serialis TaxID=139415 RepID=UPI002008D87D|nr:uncharacterized protein B0H18DRAFT_659507 [Neoantrodia serialis]KAH9918962.1 hypothetical protein B0H18DRAFT_659507 [Neoantrodia serialis]
MPSDSSSDHDSVDNVEDLREMHPLIELSDSDDSCNEDANGPSNSASDVDDDSGNEEDSSPGDLPRLISVHEMCAEEDREAQAAAFARGLQHHQCRQRRRQR